MPTVAHRCRDERAAAKSSQHEYGNADASTARRRPVDRQRPRHPGRHRIRLERCDRRAPRRSITIRRHTSWAASTAATAKRSALVGNKPPLHIAVGHGHTCDRNETSSPSTSTRARPATRTGVRRMTSPSASISSAVLGVARAACARLRDHHPAGAVDRYHPGCHPSTSSVSLPLRRTSLTNLRPSRHHRVHDRLTTTPTQRPPAPPVSDRRAQGGGVPGGQ